MLPQSSGFLVVLREVRMIKIVFWDVTKCRMVEHYVRFEGTDSSIFMVEE
jgi:hypothetical protein